MFKSELYIINVLLAIFLQVYTVYEQFICFSDNIKNKEKYLGKKKKKKMKMKLEESNNENDAEDFFEDSPPFDLNASFYQMNLSRPLLKVRKKVRN